MTRIPPKVKEVVADMMEDCLEDEVAWFFGMTPSSFMGCLKGGKFLAVEVVALQEKKHSNGHYSMTFPLNPKPRKFLRRVALTGGIAVLIYVLVPSMTVYAFPVEMEEKFLEDPLIRANYIVEDDDDEWTFVEVALGYEVVSGPIVTPMKNGFRIDHPGGADRGGFIAVEDGKIAAAFAHQIPEELKPFVGALGQLFNFKLRPPPEGPETT